MDIHSDWKYILEDELNKPYFINLLHNVELMYQSQTCYPPKNQIFRALNETPFSETKVVILGQDPYHGADQANGLSFSVNKEQSLPPSLKNIYKELVNDLGCHFPTHGDLTHWANQGVLMLNTVLTVNQGEAHSHAHLGWQTFTNRVIEVLNERKEHLVFVLWGKHAQKNFKYLNQQKHLIIESPHPSPLSAYRGFFGSKPFTKANQFLKRHHINEIQWC
ncbi:uracil-DNA glycosylase [Aquisalibacillus elongatus]|uniref:Uracil-DNA glycosylase n=1 Tax=Aquisalibacillus elongatus TaxID=485577 RepID=A0A3N5BDQ4_9BACI|nr:uracil-DNA glycosylase [Aquisalibacillus elongatus]RPF55824.1 uracil-DNA glycosylase [Aquisalibacillus elongatus]